MIPHSTGWHSKAQKLAAVHQLGASLTHKLQLVVIEALVREQLLQESHDLTGAVLVCLWQVDVTQIQHQFA